MNAAVGYAEDIKLMVRSLRAVKEVFGDLNTEGKKVGLETNESKPKALIQAETIRQAENRINLGDYNVEVVTDFTYLGTCLTNKNDELVEIQARIQVTNRSYFSILSLIKFHGINWRIRITLYKTLIRSILVRGSEAWTLPKQTVNKIDSFERKILRKTF
jgi:hypothetical protein